MQTLHRDLNPYLVELGAPKRQLCNDENLYNETNDMRRVDPRRQSDDNANSHNETNDMPRAIGSTPPIVYPYQEVTDIDSQYTAMYSILSMLDHLQFVVSLATPSKLHPQMPKIHMFTACQKETWCADYAHELQCIKYYIGMYNMSRLFDVRGQQFRDKLVYLQVMMLELGPCDGMPPHFTELISLRNFIIELHRFLGRPITAAYE